MSDITKCQGERVVVREPITGSDVTHVSRFVCPLREKCKRYLAPAGKYQSWFSDYPLKRDGTCEEFWEVPVEIRILGKKKRRGKS